MSDENDKADERLAADAEAYIAAMDRLRHADRLATLNKLASHIAHELGTPLNVIEAYATMMASGEITGAAVAKNARIIAEQAGRMTKIIKDIVTFARRHPSEALPVDLLALTRTAVALSDVAGRARKVTLELDGSSQSVEVTGDSGKLLQVIMNLILNGVQAAPEGGTVRVATGVKSHPPADDPEGPPVEHAAIEVSDQGSGIPKESLGKVFKPFFTTKKADEGAGLGLAVAQQIAKDHGGLIEVQSEVGKGSCFTVYLPRGAR
jgi:two-component system NtrC family sensor kinase